MITVNGQANGTVDEGDETAGAKNVKRRWEPAEARRGYRGTVLLYSLRVRVDESGSLAALWQRGTRVTDTSSGPPEEPEDCVAIRRRIK